MFSNMSLRLIEVKVRPQYTRVYKMNGYHMNSQAYRLKSYAAGFLGLLYAIRKDLLWSKAWKVNEFKIGRSTGRPTHCQSSIDALNTATPNFADLLADLDPPPIKHRSLESHCTTYMADGPPIKHKSSQNHYTTYVSYIYSTMHIYPWQIDSTFLLQSSIDLSKTITPHQFHIYIAQCTYTHGRLTPPPSFNQA